MPQESSSAIRKDKAITYAGYSTRVKYDALTAELRKYSIRREWPAEDSEPRQFVQSLLCCFIFPIHGLVVRPFCVCSGRVLAWILEGVLKGS